MLWHVVLMAAAMSAVFAKQTHNAVMDFAYGLAANPLARAKLVVQMAAEEAAALVLTP